MPWYTTSSVFFGRSTATSDFTLRSRKGSRILCSSAAANRSTGPGTACQKLRIQNHVCVNITETTLQLHTSSQTHAEDHRTKSRLTPYSGVRGDEVVRLISCEDAGLDEAQQRVELLQVVLDGGPRQQDSEVN